jgi:sugar/nucleoside kinase (ribokinase family)
LTEAPNAIVAAEQIAKMGPKNIVIKRGEYGIVMYSHGQFFCLPAYPVGNVVDPTGAGDTFAGGFMGFIAKSGIEGQRDLSLDVLKEATVYGTLLASFTVQDFSLGALKGLTMDHVEKRKRDFRNIVSIPT